MPQRVLHRARQAGRALFIVGYNAAYLLLFVFVLRVPPGPMETLLLVSLLLSAWWFGILGGFLGAALDLLTALAALALLGAGPEVILDKALGINTFAGFILGVSVGWLRRERDALHQRAEALAERIVEEREAARRQAQTSERLSTVGTLVAGVAHEVNNPLTYIRLNVEENVEEIREALAGPALSPQARRTLEGALKRNETIQAGVEQIARITRSLKRVARPGEGEREPLDVNAVVEDVLDVARPRLRPGARLERALEATARPVADAAEVSQVILNLVLNAADAVDGSGVVTVRTRDAPGLLVLEVEDNGPGIPPEAQERLFTPFFTTKAEGTGLGLSIAHRIVQDHGGSLTFTTQPGHGTTFRMTLPA